MPDNPQTLEPHALGSPDSSWKQLVLGDDGAARPGVNRLLMTLGVHFFLSVILWMGVGVGRVSAAPAWGLTVYIYAGMALLYALLRSGSSVKYTEPTLTFPLVLHSLGAILIAYAVIEESRPQAMQYLCLLLVFGMLQLSRRQIYTVIALSTLGLVGIVVYKLRLFPDRTHLGQELVNVGMGALIMPTLVFVSAFARQLRARLQKQKIELAQALARMEALSVRDALTGAYTRRHSQTLLDAECVRSQRSQQPFCVALLDIDHFKRVNDAFGHAVGDAVLTEFAQHVRASSGRHHLLGRWGGEEFMLLMPQTDADQAMNAMQRVQQAVRSHDWCRHAPGLAVTFSAGIRLHAPHERLADTIAAADMALYDAKAQGRDRVLVAVAAQVTP